MKRLIFKKGALSALYFFSFILIGTLYFFSFAAASAGSTPSDNEFKAVSESVWWHRLMHYEPRILGGWKSRADGANFFVSADGKFDPEGELKASFQALNNETAPAHHQFASEKASCLYPARFLFFKTVWPQQTKQWQQPKCDRFDPYMKRLEAKSVSLIFSSYFLNSPSSAFGHTLLRFNKSDRVDRSELLDFGVNFAATMHPNPFVTNIGGLTGFLPGTFSVIPYYYKVQEYNDVESRDLWDYELNLTAFEVEMLARHFWEIGHSHFDYYYLSENCSYHMLTALEAAAPHLELSKHFLLYVIPIDTVKALTSSPGLVKAMQFRPSKRSQFIKRLSRLNVDEKRQLKIELETIKNESPEVKSQNAAVLDAAIDYWDYQYYNNLIDKDPWVAKRKSLLLESRARTGVISENFTRMTPNEESPDKGHGTSRVFVGWSQTSQNQGLVFAHRFALHELDDPTPGYLPNGEIEFFNTQVRAVTGGSEFEKGRGPIRLDQFYALSIRSFDPWHPFLPTRSWRLRVGAERVIDGGCDQCVPATASAGFGKTLGFLNQRGFITALLGTEMQYSSKLTDGGFRVGAGPEVTLNLRSNHLSFSSSGLYRYWAFAGPTQTMRFEHRLRYHVYRSLSVGLQAQHSNLFWDGQLQLIGYY